MAFGFKIEAKDGQHWLKGNIDENAPFPELVRLPDSPLKLNLRHVNTINSQGLRRMIAFAVEVAEREVEFLDCPRVFIEAVNIMPLIIGGEQHVDRIKSIFLSFHCEADHERQLSVPLKAITVNGAVMMPTVDCPVCRMPMTPELDGDLDEFFFFLTG